MKNTLYADKTTDELRELFDGWLKDYQADKLEYGRYVRFDSLIPDFLDEITTELAQRLHPDKSRYIGPDENQNYTLEVTVESCDGNITINETTIYATLDQARENLATMVGRAYYSVAGVSGCGWNSAGGGI